MGINKIDGIHQTTGGLLTEEEIQQLQEVAEEISKTVEKPKQLNTPQKEDK